MTLKENDEKPEKPVSGDPTNEVLLATIYEIVSRERKNVIFSHFGSEPGFLRNVIRNVKSVQKWLESSSLQK